MVGNGSVPNMKDLPDQTYATSHPETENGIGPPFHRGSFVGSEGGDNLYSCDHCGEDHVLTYASPMSVYWRSDTLCTGASTQEPPAKPEPKPTTMRPYNQVAGRVKFTRTPAYPLKATPRKGNTF